MAKTSNYGKWQVVRSLDEGGQAHTYVVATPTIPGKHFVLKRLKNVKRLGRFQTEVAVGLSLKAPSLVDVLDSDLVCPTPWFVMEYCSSGPLTYQPQQSWEDRLLLFQQICDGVAFAHSKGVIHRDIKPDNIFIRMDGSPAVGDFGLCFLAEDGERLTFSDEAVGSRWYIAPEFEDGRQELVSSRCDVYSLGKLLYWMMTGKVFAREKHREAEYDLTRGAKANEAYLLYELLDRMIINDPARRLADAGEVCREVEQLRRRIGMGAHAIGKGIPQLCSYCGIGTYQLAVHYRTIGQKHGYPSYVKNFGLNFIDNSKWIIQVCDHCGNVQMFRPEYAKDPDIWDK